MVLLRYPHSEDVPEPIARQIAAVGIVASTAWVSLPCIKLIGTHPFTFHSTTTREEFMDAFERVLGSRPNLPPEAIFYRVSTD
jgi:hypothetical protein